MGRLAIDGAYNDGHCIHMRITVERKKEQPTNIFHGAECMPFTIGVTPLIVFSEHVVIF